MTDDEIRAAAEEFARANKKAIAKELTNKTVFLPEKYPVTVFMAGCPGAGKTESSKNLLAQFAKGVGPVIRIDPDELRDKMPHYNGSNSSLFQAATTFIAEKMQDMAIEANQSYIFDGTLTNLEAARSNITRNIAHGRDVYIIYVYQNPLQAWEFVKAREKRDGRYIPRESFIAQYFQARENVNMLKKEFGKGVIIYLVVKNIDGTDFNYFQNIDSIDNHIPERYNTSQLEQLIVE